MNRSQGFDLGEHFFTYVRDAFDWLYRRGQEGQPRMMSIGLHTRLIGRPGRIGALARLLDHIQAHEGVWLTQPRRHRAALGRHAQTPGVRERTPSTPPGRWPRRHA